MLFDPLVHDIKNNSSKSCITSKFEFKNNLLYFEGQQYVPEEEADLCILQACHSFLAVGYFGYNKTLILISKDFWWLQM